MDTRKILAILIAVLGCSGQSTQQLLDADLIISGRTSVKLSAPANNSTVLSESSLAFSWQVIPGVGSYQFEIADSADFSNIILSKTVSSNEYAFQRSDLKSGVTVASSSYYWRVSINAAKQSVRSDVWMVNLIADSAFYVDCAFTGTSYGTRTAPFKTIQAGLDSALGARLGVTTATTEVRVAKGTCNESIAMRANVKLKGGYDPAQNWIRNPASYQSIISTTDAAAIQAYGDIGSVYTDTLIEGFKIQTTNTAGKTNSCISLVGATITIKNNYIVQVAPTGLPDPSLPLISVTAGGNLTLNSNILSISSSSAVTGDIISGILANNGNLAATNNIIYVNATNAIGTTVIYLINNSAASPTFTVQNNTIFVSYTSSTTTNASRGVATYRSAGSISGAFDRNIIFMLGPAKQNRCGQQVSPGYFTSVKSNAMVDCNHSTNGFWYTNVNFATGYAAPWTTSVGATAALSVNIDTPLINGAAGANTPTNCTGAGACSATISGNRGGNSVPGTPTLPGDPTVVFQGYTAGDPTTFAFKPNAIADMDNNGSYDASIDAGANTATAGLIALP